MTHGEKIRYLHTALALEGLKISEMTADLIVTTFDEVVDKKDKFKIRDAEKIQREIKDRYQERLEKDKHKEEIEISGRSTSRTLQEWMQEDKTTELLKSLTGKYKAGTPLRLKTIILKYGNQDLLNKGVEMIVKDDIVKLPRAGELLWNIFQEVRDYSK